MPDENNNIYSDDFKSTEYNVEDDIEDISEEKIKIDASFSAEDLLAIIAETNIDNKSLIEEIRNSNEMEGLSFNTAEANEIVVVIVGKKLLECTAKTHIEAYEKVAFITTKDGSTIYAVPLKISVDLKNTSNTNINPATEDKQDDIITQLESGITGLATSAKQDDIITGLDDVTIAKIKGIVSTNNSSTTPLIIGGVFTGAADDISDYAAVDIALHTDEDSATDGLSLEWSQDGTNWDEKISIDIHANEVWSYEFGVRARYFRVVYTNGTIAQGTFRLQVMYHPQRTRLGARSIETDIDEHEFAPTRRVILAAKKPDGTYENIHATAGANLKVSVEESEIAFPIGTGSNGSVTLTIAATAYAIPAIASTKNHIIILYNGSDTDIFVGFQNTNANGIPIPAGGVMNFDLGANQQLFSYCASASKVLTYSLKELT